MRTNIDIDDELMTKAGNGAITDRTLNPGHRVCPAPAGMNRRLPELPARCIPTYLGERKIGAQAGETMRGCQENILPQRSVVPWPASFASGNTVHRKRSL